MRRQLSHCHQGAFSLVKPGAMKVVGRSFGGLFLSAWAGSCSGGMKRPISIGEIVMNFSSIRLARDMYPYNVGPPSHSSRSIP